MGRMSLLLQTDLTAIDATLVQSISTETFAVALIEAMEFYEGFDIDNQTAARWSCDKFVIDQALAKYFAALIGSDDPANTLRSEALNWAEEYIEKTK